MSGAGLLGVPAESRQHGARSLAHPILYFPVFISPYLKLGDLIDCLRHGATKDC